ncbi:MAG TPA: RNA pseudouridine synthase [Rhabdochlamydiaceae bacterium]|jgi:23S rRNA pseudouridine1911/1915/1917 synthase|nr:RNA pseudouridine synthase [Rhabdochlamydiaceae bacterium]
MNHLDNVSIVYSDNHLLIVEKPAEMATQPDLTELAKAWIKQKYNKPGNVFLHAVHRLDKAVSGLVIFARTSKALSRLQEMMRDRKIVKIYHALVEGKLPGEHGRLEHYLIHGNFRAEVSKEGKESILEFQVLRREKNSTLLEIHLITGRYHQIRAQFAAIGCPVVGDEKYGSKRPWKKGIALHHSEIRFEHPVTKESLVLKRNRNF